ncbi:hypothetical protein DFH11DRAFT_1577595 [Phellopilus nigrolimitatus]|nr:hypothetical protein DFH11DRAFT_1577595 [Phellopilus nigrolimitatus]
MKRTNPSSERASTSQKRSQKKTRFVSPGDDPTRFAEDVDAQLEDSKSATRRGRVKTEGYDSDSSDDGEGVVSSRKKRTGDDGVEDDDDDMFAVGDKEETAENTSTARKKKAEYLRLGDIEGQEFNEASGSGSDVSEGEPEDEDDAERRKKAGMGFELSSFNMREEMEEGKFTEDGSFVRTFDPHAIHDRWLDDTDDREMKRARRAKRVQEKAEKEKLKAEAREAQQTGNKEDIEKEMLSILKRGETVLEALARLGAKAKKTKGKEKSTKKPRTHRSSMDVDGKGKPPPTPKQDPSKPKTQIEHLTTLASSIMSFGDVDIYSKTYEHLLRSVRASGSVEPDWTPPDVKYEYKWDVPEAQLQSEGADPQVFGPFGEDEMKAWYSANYFGDSGEKVKVRASGGDWGDWDDVVD